ncbi:MAG: tetratricopeptide repeat protein [Phycisphaeraceae bacterium]
MNQRLFASLLIAFSTLGTFTVSAHADAKEDFAAGRSALSTGDLDKALSLLKSAAQALPESVEAQLALGDCYLQLGQVDEALAQFRAVVKLSPQHARATKLIETLTARHRTIQQKLAAAAELVNVKSYQNAINLLVATLRESLEPAQRDGVRLRIAEYYLLWGNSELALSEAVQLVAELSTPEGKAEAHAIAALAAAGLGRYEQAAQSAAKAGAAPQSWKDRLAIVSLLTELNEKKDFAALSARVGKTLAALPDSTLREKVTKWIFDQLVAAAQQHVGKGDPASALGVLWPMVSGAALPGDEAVLKELKLAGGWLGSEESQQPYWLAVADQLAGIGAIELQGPARSQPRSYWLAAQVIRSAPAADQARAEAVLKLIERLAAESSAAPDRKPGQVLSGVDALQRELIVAIAPLLSQDHHRDRLVNAALAHIQRYAAANDLKTGVAQFVSVKDEANQPKPMVAVQVTLPRGKAQAQLLQQLAAHFQTMGEAAYNEAARTLDAAANTALQPDDTVALILFSRLIAEQPSPSHGTAIIERYANAEHWDAAARAIDLLYAGSADAAWFGRWKTAALKIRQGQAEEHKLLNLGRRLAPQLHPLIRQALASQVELLQQAPTQAHRALVIQTADPMVHRYLGLDRRDLVEQVLTVTAALPANANVTDLADLRDWALWVRAYIAEREAGVALARAAKAAGDATLPLEPQHKAQIDFLSELLKSHPRSGYVAQVVGKVTAIAALYENHRSFDTAATVLAGFIQAHPKIDAAERLEYALTLVSLKKARVAFAERKDKDTPPAQLSPEFTAAIKSLSDFLKAHPTGPFALQAEAELLSIVRQYGEVNAWPVARLVIAQMAAAGPDANQRRTPGYIRLLEAATHIGELDRAYGLHLLSPSPKTGNANEPGNALALAVDDSGLAISGRLGDFDQSYRYLSKLEPPQTATPKPAGEAAAGSRFSNGGIADPSAASRPRDSELALVMVRRSEQQHLAQIARMNQSGQKLGEAPNQQAAQSGPQIHLPSGAVLSEAAMKDQDEAADKAYAILLELIKAGDVKDASNAARQVADAARAHVFWMFSFFEGQLRADRALVIINQYLKDRPTEPDRIALAFRAVTDRVAFASHTSPTDRINLAWVAQRHDRFEQARADIARFITAHQDKTTWVNQARMLAFDTFLREADLIAPVADVRAAGLLMRASDELVTLLQNNPQHPECTNFPNHMWNIADRLAALGQREQSIYILNRITVAFPTHQLARQAVLRVGQTYAADLASPLRAVETYQEYLSQNGDDASVREQIFSIASQLSSRQRYVESLHVYGVFVDSFPSDPRAAAALQAIGAIHQANEVWNEAVASYERIIADYPGAAVIPQVNLAIAECQINLSQWFKARRTYEEFVAKFPNDGSGAIAKGRIEILKNLDRYQKLLDDKEVDRNKDDAQFQIGRIVLEQLQYTDKAIREFRKVVADFPKSHQADDAQFEIGLALLRVGRLDEAREELLKVVSVYPNSPLADNALFMVGQSFEQQANRLSTVTVQVARADAFERGQRLAYTRNQAVLEQQKSQLDEIRRDFKSKGDARGLGIEEAYANWKSNDFNKDNASLLNREAELQAECDSAMEIANRQDRINEAYREAVAKYAKAAAEYPLGDKTSEALLRMAEIYEVQLKDKDNAMKTYEKVVKFFPGTPVAEDAAWKVAQFHDQQTQYEAAVQAYRDFIRNYPASKRVAEAQFAMAEALEQLGRWVEAMDAYQTFRDKFAQHAKAPQALEQINWIKAYRR